MIRIIGDVHGLYFDYMKLIQPVSHSVQLGDFGGFGYFKYSEIDKFGDIDHANHQIIMGNHDNYDDRPPWELGDYGMHTMNDIPFFIIRGAYSIDQNHRVMGRDWWAQEELSIVEGNATLEAYCDASPSVVMSHDCPFEMYQRVGTREAKPSRTSALLQACFEAHQPKFWFFGHHHVRDIQCVGRTQFIALGELDHWDFEL